MKFLGMTDRQTDRQTHIYLDHTYNKFVKLKQHKYACVLNKMSERGVFKG